MRRLTAVKHVAKTHRVDHQTVTSACTRSLGINTEELDDFLRRDAVTAFCAHLVRRFPEHQDYIEKFFRDLSGGTQAKPDGDLTRRLETLFPDEQKQLLKVLLLQEAQQSLSRWLQRPDLPVEIRNEMQELHEKVKTA
jgi:hypothetical protein